MGKSDDPHHHPIDIPADSAANANANAGGPLRRCAARIGAAFSLKCVIMLLLGVSLLLSALFCLPFFRGTRRSGFLSDDPDALTADIQARFILKRPFSDLVSQIGMLEYDIFEEIGVPNTKVSVVSMQSLNDTNSTCVVFAVLPNPNYASISMPALSVLRSSLVELVQQQLNLSLSPSIFGQPSKFEVLKFPGGITVIPLQTAIWEIGPILFNLTLNSSIHEIRKDVEELKAQLKVGLNLRAYENIYVQMTNVNGSTLSPPVIVQASVLSDYGTRLLRRDRLKQLAHVIEGPHAENFGLNHSVFGKVKAVQLSSYLRHYMGSPSPSPSPSPSLSPAPSKKAPYNAYSPSNSVFRHAPNSPSSPPSYAPEPEIGPKPPSQSIISPGPSMPDIAPRPRQNPCDSSSPPPRPSPMWHPHAFSPIYNAPNGAFPYHKELPLTPTTQITPPKLSPLAPMVVNRPSPLQGKGNVKNPMPPVSALADISPSLSNSASNYGNKWFIRLLTGAAILHLLLFHI